MDVIDELIAYCEAWEPWARVMGNVCAGDAAQALRSLRAELAEWRKDAERYRWLRDKCRDGSLTIARADDWSLHPWSGDDIDKEIDAARKGEETT